MFEVDRIAAIIKPKQKMLNWLKDQPNINQDYSLEELRRDCTVLLIPAFPGPKEARAYIEAIYTGIFESELESWGFPENTWPVHRSSEVFFEWFDVEYHSMVFDIADFEKPAVNN